MDIPRPTLGDIRFMIKMEANHVYFFSMRSTVSQLDFLKEPDLTKLTHKQRAATYYILSVPYNSADLQ